MLPFAAVLGEVAAGGVHEPFACTVKPVDDTRAEFPVRGPCPAPATLPQDKLQPDINRAEDAEETPNSQLVLRAPWLAEPLAENDLTALLE